MRRSISLCAGLVCASMFAMAGCASSTTNSGGAAASDAAMGAVNSKCPMRPNCTNPMATTTDYNGQKVAFCCSGCVKAWNDLDDATKAERLAAVMGKGR